MTMPDTLAPYRRGARLGRDDERALVEARRLVDVGVFRTRRVGHRGKGLPPDRAPRRSQNPPETFSTQEREPMTLKIPSVESQSAKYASLKTARQQILAELEQLRAERGHL